MREVKEMRIGEDGRGGDRERRESCGIEDFPWKFV